MSDSQRKRAKTTTAASKTATPKKAKGKAGVAKKPKTEVGKEVGKDIESSNRDITKKERSKSESESSKKEITKKDTKKKDNKSENTDLPALPKSEPAHDSFLVVAGTYERILYGLEARVVGSVMTLNPQFIFPAHIGCIKAVSAGGRYLASGSTDEVIKLYDLKKRVELGSLHEHSGSITALQFHGSSHLLSASEDGVICIFRTNDWEPLKMLRGHKGAVNSIAIHPSGKLALSVAQDRTIIIWNLLTGQRASRVKTPQVGEIVAWSPPGSHYIVAYATEVQVYKVGQTESLATVFSKQRILCALVASYESAEYVLCGSQDKRIHIYSADGVERASVVCHENRIKGMSLVDVVLDGVVHAVVVSISSDGRIKTWKLADLLDPIRKNAEQPTTSDEVMDLVAEPLATYNADVRLTCVASSTATF
ncbi:60s ribosome biogenesis protein mak11 [Coemansia sp. RSA 1972]|nr:60s ribosome biogenesis protein mak11 [Coemansia sp. RSA 1972]